MANKSLTITEKTMEKFKKLIPLVWLAKGTKQTADSIIDMLVSEKLQELEKQNKEGK